ncbi:MAG: glycosyltransferase [Rufibacter sp.]
MGKTVVFTVTTDLSHDQRMQRIATTLAEAGFEVTLVGRLLPSSPQLAPASYQQIRFKCFFRKGPLFYLEYNLRLILWFTAHKFELYGTVDADTAFAGLVTTWWRRKPLIYDAHELFPELPEVVNRPLVQKVWRWLEQKAFSRATLAYTVSGSLVHYFQQQNHREVKLIRNMPLRKPVIGGSAQPPYFIYQGALNEGRGLEATIHAMLQVDAQLLICGDGPLRSELEQLVQVLRLESKVRFQGNVPPTELVSLTQKAYAGIMLLENKGLSYYYSLANKFFDYVQAGIPQVCVPFPEYQTLIGEHEVALLVEARPEPIQAALNTLLQDQVVYERLRRNCLQARENWVWEEEGTRLVQLYNQL